LPLALVTGVIGDGPPGRGDLSGSRGRAQLLGESRLADAGLTAAEHEASATERGHAVALCGHRGTNVESPATVPEAGQLYSQSTRNGVEAQLNLMPLTGHRSSPCTRVDCTMHPILDH
jgi:hypothetical protein